MIIAGVLIILRILIISAVLGSYPLILHDLAIPISFLGGFLSIMRIGHKGTTTCVLVAGIFIALRLVSTLFLITLGALIFALIVADLISSKKSAFGF
ncbi:MAG: hypothetical protein ACE5QW_05870 [Thermoplasmata archaeon]